jgi:hypothetical protein
MMVRSCLIAFSIAFAITAASGASAVEVANGLSVNGLSTNGLSVNGTEKSADLSLKAIVLQDEQVLVIE